MEKMRFLSSTKDGKEVREALERVTDELNEELSEVPGYIVGFEGKVNLGLSGAEVRMIVVVDGRKIRSKRLLWTNKSGSSQDEALDCAREDINSKIENISGEIADYDIKYKPPNNEEDLRHDTGGG